MPKALQWLLSLIFIVQMYLAMLVLGIVFLIPAALDRRQVVGRDHIHLYARAPDVIDPAAAAAAGIALVDGHLGRLGGPGEALGQKHAAAEGHGPDSDRRQLNRHLHLQFSWTG